MSKKSSEIIQEVLSYINKCTGKYYGDYYAGITSDPEKRLFTDHNVERKGCWIYMPAVDIDNARKAEEQLNALGMKGAGGGGDDSSIYVYCYQITIQTKEQLLGCYATDFSLRNMETVINCIKDSQDH